MAIHEVSLAGDCLSLVDGGNRRYYRRRQMNPPKNIGFQMNDGVDGDK